MNIVQLIRNGARQVALVEGNRLRLTMQGAPTSVYALALKAIDSGATLQAIVEESLGEEHTDYDAVHEGASEWRLLASFDHPSDPARCMVTGTGLTHKASAENRAAMHKKSAAEITDSISMYRMGLEGGSPAQGRIGVQPEWFFRGDGTTVRAHGEDLEIPPYACDGGEEPEIAGAYVISPAGIPCRVGMTMGNEFSDHKMEKQNYLYLAPSKLRNCAIGPELRVGPEPFDNVPGSVRILRMQSPLWSADIWSGEKNMSHSVQNLEHHHFKYETHRRPGDCHIHFFGADAFSFGEGLALEDGDIMEVSFAGFGRPLRNPVRVTSPPESLVRVEEL